MSLPPELRDALAKFVHHERILVASDFDGVLAPLVQNPLDSRATPGTLEALATLANTENVYTAIASGRDLGTLRILTNAPPEITLIGSHGAESSEELHPIDALGLSEAQQRTLDEATRQLARIADKFGARVEHKPAGVVLHTRGLPDEAAMAATQAALGLESLPGVHTMAGKSVVELAVLDVSKGAALTALAQKLGAEATFYMGDDVTDETAFRTLSATDVTVKIGEGATAAQFRLDIEDVLPVLQYLASLRS